MKGDLPTQFTGPDESPGFLLWQVANAWQRRQRQSLDEIGLTHVQFVLLAGLDWLGNENLPITQVALSRTVRVDEMMTSQVIRVLEQRGAVERATHPNDSRAKCVRLTEIGIGLLARAVPLVEKTDETFFQVEGVTLSDVLHIFKTIARHSRQEEELAALRSLNGQHSSHEHNLNNSHDN